MFKLFVIAAQFPVTAVAGPAPESRVSDPVEALNTMIGKLVRAIYYELTPAFIPGCVLAPEEAAPVIICL